MYTVSIVRVTTGHWWIGDYQGLAAGASKVYACWNDTRSGRLEIYVAAEPISHLGLEPGTEDGVGEVVREVTF